MAGTHAHAAAHTATQNTISMQPMPAQVLGLGKCVNSAGPYALAPNTEPIGPVTPAYSQSQGRAPWP